MRRYANTVRVKCGRDATLQGRSNYYITLNVTGHKALDTR